MMTHRTKFAVSAAAGVAALALGGCSTVEVEYTGARSYLLPYGDSDVAPGPSLVAGDQLAYRMVLAGAYDVPAVFDNTGYAQVEILED